MADQLFPDKTGVAAWKREQGVKQPYKGKTKQTTTTTTQPQWLTNLRKQEKTGQQRQAQRTTQYQQEYQQWLARQKEPSQQQYEVERDNFIIANVPDYMKAMVPMEYFKQYSTEVIPEVIDTLNWGLFYGDTGGKWTQGLTEAHYAAKYRLIPPDALLQKGMANMRKAGILPEEEPTEWELEQREMKRTEMDIKMEQADRQRRDSVVDQITYLADNWSLMGISAEEKNRRMQELITQYDSMNYIQPDISNAQFMQRIWDTMLADVSAVNQPPPDIDTALRAIKQQFDMYTEDEIMIALEQFQWQKKVDELKMSSSLNVDPYSSMIRGGK